MGIYLNGTTAYTLYKSETESPYFVDKSQMLEELFPLVSMGNKHICITRPRRFGKTVMANMVASFFSKGCDAQDVFDKLAISRDQKYNQYCNQYSVIHISFNDIAEECISYKQYIGRIRSRLVEDLRAEYPDVKTYGEGAVIDTLMDIYARDSEARFIFVLDEWDFIFHQDFVTEEDKKAYLRFLRSLLKDRPYVLMTYMTGILPIAKYSSGSELNMFLEYTMITEERFSESFGFTEAEVDVIFSRYQKMMQKAKITREGLKTWYNGYHTCGGERVYNPRSVVSALANNNLGNYWTSADPYDEIYYYIENNVGDVRDSLVLMISGISVSAKIREYAATSMNLQKCCKKTLLTAIVNLVYLAARDTYRIEREDKVGKGYVDFIFYPETDKNADCIILELKVGAAPEAAIQQIKDRDYALRLKGKSAESLKYTGRILAVGISYDKESKQHSCQVEVLS